MIVRRRGFVGLTPDGGIIAQSTSSQAKDVRDWIVKWMRTSDEQSHWVWFYDRGYRVHRCIIEVELRGRRS